MTVRLEDIRSAARTIAGKVNRTPLLRAANLSAKCRAEVLLKLENLQLTGSFKTRGALVKLASLSVAQARRGVIAISAGNHAQGVAYHARKLGIKATIVMPETTPFTKVENTEELGARVILEGRNLAECRGTAEKLIRRERLVFIPPYDDPRIIAGQGTIGLEMIEDDPGLDTVLVPIGGGGLIAGIATALKALKPDIRVIGVQTAAYPAMALALRGRKARPARESASTLADGIAVKAPGKLTRAIARKLVDRVLLVDEPFIEQAIQCLITEEKLVVEGAGAVPLAALLQHGPPRGSRRVGLVVSGGNIDSRLLGTVLMRGLARDGRIGRLRVPLDDTPGALAKMAAVIGEADGNIIEIVHQRLFFDVPARMAEIDVMVETQDAAHLRAVLSALKKSGFRPRLLGNDSR